MYSDELIQHPELQPLMKKYKKAFPKVDLECEMLSLGWFGYTGMGLNVEAVKEILNKCLKENKYFKVWSMNWKDPEPIPCDWWQGKIAYYTYKG